jgi:hypothetical protein
MIRLLRMLFFLNAAVWLALAVATVARVLSGGPDQALAAGIAGS